MLEIQNNLLKVQTLQNVYGLTTLRSVTKEAIASEKHWRGNMAHGKNGQHGGQQRMPTPETILIDHSF